MALRAGAGMQQVAQKERQYDQAPVSRALERCCTDTRRRAPDV